MTLSCLEQLDLDLDACDAQWEQDKADCNGDPVCITQAIFRRQACENAAYTKYYQCVNNLSEGGAPDCGCVSGD